MELAKETNSRYWTIHRPRHGRRWVPLKGRRWKRMKRVLKAHRMQQLDLRAMMRAYYEDSGCE